MKNGQRRLKNLLYKIKYIVALFLIGLLIIAFLYSPKKNSPSLRIGIGDDSSGMVLNYMLKNKRVDTSIETVTEIESSTMLDCWGASGKWALGSDALDIAIVCSSAGDDLLSKSDEFVKVQALVKNADVIVKKKETIEKIGTSQNRIHKNILINKRFPGVKAIPMLDRSLGFALEKGEVDGVLVDAKKALLLNGDKEETYSIMGDYDSYVMIANKKILSTNEYKKFRDEYNNAVDEINTDKGLESVLKEKFENKVDLERGISEWKKWHVVFQKIP